METDGHGSLQGRSPAVLAVSIAFIACATIFVFLRLISRGAVVKRLAPDDWLMVLAWLLSFGMSFAVCYGTAYGLGRHETDIPTSWQETLHKANYAFSVLYNPSLMLEKTSILVFYLTLSHTRKIFRWATITTLVVVNAGGLALTLLNIFQCNPVGAVFDQVIPEGGYCTDVITIYLSSAPLNIITDLAILFLPLPILTSMHLPTKQKIILIITFSFGAFAAAVDVVRISALQSAAQARLSAISSDQSLSGSGGHDQYTQLDVSWYAAFSFMWSVIEVNVGIMCGCVPALKPLVSRFLPHMLRDSADDATVKSASIAFPRPTFDMTEEQRVPSVSDSIEHQQPPRTHSQASTSMLDFLTTPDMVHQRTQSQDMSYDAMDFITTPDQGRLSTQATSRTTDHRRIQSQDGSVDIMDFLTTPDKRKLEPSSPVSDTTAHEPAQPQEESMDMMDFLTIPEMGQLDRTQTAMTNTTRHTKPSAPVFFDFVNMKQKKGLVYLTNRESVFPVAMVTVLFFVWGFEYGLLDVLNTQFQQVAHMTPGQTTAIHSAYYAGYILGPWLIGRWVLEHWGFKACFSVGLSIYACGTLIFWPAAVLTSFPTYLIVNLIVGAGLSILEVAANPFISLCGPARYAEVRLNLSQGVQAIGTVIAPIIADVAIVQQTSTVQSLITTQYAYLGIALFTVLLAVAYHYVPLPEVTNAELEDVSERLDGANKARIGQVRITTIVLALCAVGQFCYVGAQEVNGTGFADFLGAVEPDLSVPTYVAIAHTAFVVSRFLGAVLAIWIQPRLLMLGFFLGAIVFQALAISLSGGAALAMLVVVFFMEGPLFSLLFAQALRGQGRHTKLASVVITSMISGGAAFSPASNIVATGSVGGQRSLVVAVAVFAAGALAVIVLNAIPQARTVVDPIKSSVSVEERTASLDSGGRRKSSFLKHITHLGRSSGSAEYKERAHL